MTQRLLCCLQLAAVALAVTFSAPASATNLKKHETHGTHLDKVEIDALRDRIAQYWNVAAGLPDADKVKVSIKLKLNRSANIDGYPTVTAMGGPDKTREVIATSAYRAAIKSAPFEFLPPDKYDAWKEVTINFQTSDLAH
ncbi:MAG: hypothetical protein KGI75_15970 [Rhizobiaceae bacterium]|nr:hypothetical protein [Rhizobiaceae bacterium]